MSVALRDVKRRMASTRQIKQVTSAMQRVSGARLVRDKQEIGSSRYYTEHLGRLIRDMCDAASDDLPPALTGSQGATRRLVFAFGSDRGLCGGFNTMLYEHLAAFVIQAGMENVDLVTVGKVVTRRARRRGLSIFKSFEQPLRSEREALMTVLVDLAEERWRTGEYQQVATVYVRYESGLNQSPQVQTILPARMAGGGPLLEDEESVVGHGSSGLAGALFEPDVETILKQVVPEFVSRSIYYSFLHSLASEDAARQATMSRASENASALLDELTMNYSRLRQGQITREMIELAGGM